MEDNIMRVSDLLSILNVSSITIKDGEIYSVVGTKPLNRLMDVPEIKVIEKLNFGGLSANTVKYEFKTNHHTDQIWRYLFSQEPPEAKASFHGDTLEIYSDPQSIQDKYNSVKSAIERANVAYAETKPLLVAYAQEQEDKKLEEKRAKEHLESEVEKGFDSLEL